jgi:hypothetical protein
VVTDVVDVGVKREEPMLAVDGAQDPFSLRNFQASDRRKTVHGLERQFFVAGDDHRARNGRKVLRLPALLVILDEFVDLSPDDLPLVGFLARCDAAFEQVPVHLRRRLLLAAAHGLLPGIAVTQHLETNELIDILGRESGLVELHAKLLHPDRSDADHSKLPSAPPVAARESCEL